MIEEFIKYINDKEKVVIFDIGSRDCKQSIEFYKTFQMQKYTPSNVIQIHGHMRTKYYSLSRQNYINKR